jgi:hypothetical protein
MMDQCLADVRVHDAHQMNTRIAAAIAYIAALLYEPSFLSPRANARSKKMTFRRIIRMIKSIISF